MGFKLNFK